MATPKLIAVIAVLAVVAGGTSMNGCRKPSARPGPHSSLEDTLRSTPALEAAVRRAEQLRFQVLVGWIESSPDGPILRQEAFRPAAEYFYPASSIKLFAAVAALEHLHDLRRESGLPIDVDTPLVYFPLFADEELEETDPSNLAGGRITVGHEIRKLFLVSDNQAFNRLYELVGQDGLAASLTAAGLGEIRIVHRLSESRDAGENRRYPRIDFVGEGFRYTLRERQSAPLAPAAPHPGLSVGRAYISEGMRIEAPMDFSAKNRASLEELQRGLCMVVRPDVDCGGPGFALTREDRALLLEAMHQYPRQSTNPVYPATDYPDGWVKFLLPGLKRVIPEDRLRIHNKSGRAYGFSTENSQVVDIQTGDSFFLATTLYTNRDGVLNDDLYEYDSVADPLLADLGEAVARQFRGSGLAH